MKHVRGSEVDPAEPIEGVHLKAHAIGEKTSAQEFSIEPGAVVPEHSHPHEQTGFVYEGELTLVCEGEPIVLEAGDSFSIPGGQAHSAKNDGDVSARGVDIFSPPRGDPDWAE